MWLIFVLILGLCEVVGVDGCCWIGLVGDLMLEKILEMLKLGLLGECCLFLVCEGDWDGVMLWLFEFGLCLICWWLLLGNGGGVFFCMFWLFLMNFFFLWVCFMCGLVFCVYRIDCFFVWVCIFVVWCCCFDDVSLFEVIIVRVLGECSFLIKFWYSFGFFFRLKFRDFICWLYFFWFGCVLYIVCLIWIVYCLVILFMFVFLDIVMLLFFVRLVILDNIDFFRVFVGLECMVGRFVSDLGRFLGGVYWGCDGLDLLFDIWCIFDDLC